LYPPAPSGKPALTAKEVRRVFIRFYELPCLSSTIQWFDGQNKPIDTVSMKPEGSTSVYDVPEVDLTWSDINKCQRQYKTLYRKKEAKTDKRNN